METARIKPAVHLGLVALAAILLGALFLQEPGFGDDLTYWSFAFNLHERGLEAWQKHSFHDLRWPVWGVCWLLQAVIGPGIISYWGAPLLYVAAGAMLSFVFAKRLTNLIGAGWACAIAFIFHPLLDTVAYRPMPDLSEGIWAAAVMLAWWMLMHARTRAQLWLYTTILGVSVFVIEANRVTGVFIVPVLILGTAIFFRRRFGWLVLAGVIAIAFYSAESAFYHRLFGDWLHDFSANSGNKEAKGTELAASWKLPFRFLDTFFGDELLSLVYSIPAVIGAIAAWRRYGTLGRVIVLWVGVVFLEYSCGIQSLHPMRPLVRDADRFLGGLAVPLSALTILGFITIVANIPGMRVRQRVGHLVARPIGKIALGFLMTIALLGVTSREYFNRGFVPRFRQYLASLPPNTRVFTHREMRELSYMMDAHAASHLQWATPHHHLLQFNSASETAAAQSDEFWYARKIVWLPARKRMEQKRDDAVPKLASYFATPENEWQLAQVLIAGDTPDLVFYRHRKADTPRPEVLPAAAPEFRDLLPTLPLVWESGKGEHRVTRQWRVPDRFKGRLMRIEFEGASPHVEPLTVRLHFRGQHMKEQLVILKPYLSQSSRLDFFAFAIPRDCETCEIQLRFAKHAEPVTITNFRAVLESP